MLKALGSGLVGAVALTLIHETARRVAPETAPRMDVLGMRAIQKAARAVGDDPPVPLHEAALVGDIISNSFYYSLIGAGARRDAVRNGALLGLAAGLGAVYLPGPLGLGRQPNHQPATQALTVAWYVAGGLAAGTAYAALASDDE